MAGTRALGRLAALLSFLALAGCVTPLLDAPEQVRKSKVPLAPAFSWLVTCERSDDGNSTRWSGPLWLFGHEREATRHAGWIFPLWWSWGEEPYSENTLLFPLFYRRDASNERWRFFTPFYGFIDGEHTRSDYVLGPVLHWSRSKTEDVSRSGMLFVWDWQHHGPRHDFTLVPVLGLAHLAKFEWGYPPEGESVPALGRSASRRFELLNLAGFVTLFGYDDVGDRREIRLFTLLSSEMLSPLRSWRGRGDDPFVREWLFPLYMNVQDSDGGWLYVGPLWGRTSDRVAARTTDWWLAGLLSRTRTPDGNTWRVLGIPVSWP